MLDGHTGHFHQIRSRLDKPACCATSMPALATWAMDGWMPSERPRDTKSLDRHAHPRPCDCNIPDVCKPPGMTMEIPKENLPVSGVANLAGFQGWAGYCIS